MAYETQTWQTGDTITAAKLNHMEDGIGNSMQYSENAYFVNLLYDVEGDYYDSDKTLSEIIQAYNAGKTIYGNFRLYIPDEIDKTTTVKLEPKYGASSEILSFSYVDIISLNSYAQLVEYSAYGISNDDNVTRGYVYNSSDKIFFPTSPGIVGTYVLKLTVTSDGATMSWVAE